MRLPGLLTGGNPLVGWLNALRATVASATVTGVVGGRFERGAWGTVIHVDPRGGSGSPVTKYKVKSHHGDYLTCRTWDGTNEGTTDIHIAKPPELRNSVLKETIDTIEITYSAHNEGDQTRIATDGSTTETHIIVPRYLTEGDNPTIIRARRVVGGTGVTIPGPNTPTDDEILTLEDDNAGGRAWAKQA